MIDYFDASAVAAVLLNEPSREAIDGHIAGADAPPQVSDFVVAEVSSTVSRLVRMGAASVEDANLILADLDEWVGLAAQSDEVESSDIREATLLVRRFDLKLRTPDALHLAICRRLEARLVTLDKNLVRAARALDVPCINPADVSAL